MEFATVAFILLSCKMADSSLVVQSCLCSLVNKYNKLHPKQLKSMTVDFYDVQQIINAKDQLIANVGGMNLNADLRHILRRRDGELMVACTCYLHYCSWMKI